MQTQQTTQQYHHLPGMLMWFGMEGEAAPSTPKDFYNYDRAAFVGDPTWDLPFSLELSDSDDDDSSGGSCSTSSSSSKSSASSASSASSGSGDSNTSSGGGGGGYYGYSD